MLVPEVEDVEGRAPCWPWPAGPRIRLHRRDGVDPADPDVGEVPLEQRDELVAVEEVDVEGVLEVGRLVGGEEEGGSVLVQAPGPARRRGPPGRAKCSIRCDEQTQSKRALGQPQGQGVHLGHPEALAGKAGSGRARGRLGAVVDAHHGPVGAGEAEPTRSPAAAHVEHPARPSRSRTAR